VLRPSLLPNLLAAAGRNEDRGAKEVALFEMGPQFEGDRPQDQKEMAAGLRAGRTAPRHWARSGRPVEMLDAKADALAAIAAAGGPGDSLQVGTDAPSWYHPGRAGCLKLGPKVLAWFGALHPRLLAQMGVKAPVVGFELFVDAIPLPKIKATKARPPFKPSPFLSLERDFAFVVAATVPADAVLRAARGADKALIADVTVFDLYEGSHVGEGKKSLAIQVTLQPFDKTLTDAEIDAVAAKIVAAVGVATGGVLRG
jgi:phenylalanyl-tRNA synthetase beta chain